MTRAAAFKRAMRFSSLLGLATLLLYTITDHSVIYSENPLSCKRYGIVYIALMIVLTAPTGNIGHALLGRLLLTDRPLRVVVRDPLRLRPDVRARVDLVVGSHGDPATMDQALRGAESLFWLVPPNPTAPTLESAYLDFTRGACDAIRRHQVRRVVSISALGRGTPFEKSAGLVTASLAMDDLLATTGADLRAITAPSFMENLLRQAPVIREQGFFALPMPPDRPTRVCATRDIAACAADLLLDPHWKGVGHRAVLGAEDISPIEMAKTMSEVLCREIRFVPVSIADFAARLEQLGMSPAFVAGYAAMMDAKSQGLDDAEPRTPQSTTPTSFRRWCEEALEPVINAPQPR